MKKDKLKPLVKALRNYGFAYSNVEKRREYIESWAFGECNKKISRIFLTGIGGVALYSLSISNNLTTTVGSAFCLGYCVGKLKQLFDEKTQNRKSLETFILNGTD